VMLSIVELESGTENLVESPAKLVGTASVIIEYHYFCYGVG
jgi:hypothetical protein